VSNHEADPYLIQKKRKRKITKEEKDKHKGTEKVYYFKKKD